MKRVSFADLQKLDATTQPGILQRAMNAGRLLPGNIHLELPNDFEPSTLPPSTSPPRATSPEPLPEPTINSLVINFMAATAKWASSGFKVVDVATYSARAAACAGCEHWDATARLGLGHCKAPGCGCTKLKRWLATEHCPLHKWPS